MSDHLSTVEQLRHQLAVFASQDYRMSLPSMQAITEIAYVMARDNTNIVPQSELVAALPATHASVSRAITYWSTHSARSVIGKGFVQTSQNIENRRHTDLRLTPKGGMFVRSLFSNAVAHNRE